MKKTILFAFLVGCSLTLVVAQNITDPGNLTFCNQSGTVSVNETVPTAPSFVYNFYPSATSPDIIAAYNNVQGPSTIDLTSPDLIFTGTPPNRSTTVYVEDDCGTTNFTGTLSEIDNCAGRADFNTDDQESAFAIRATPLTIMSVSIFSSATQNYDVSVVIRNDADNIIYTSPRATGQAISGTEIIIPMNFTLAPNATYSITTDTRIVAFARCFPAGILRDDSNIELVRDASNDKLGNPFFNLVFVAKSPSTCPRVPFTLTESCPTGCTQSSPIISGTSACVGDNLVLTATPPAGTTSPTYQWYADGVAITVGGTGATYTVPTGSAAEEVVYTATITESNECSSSESAPSNELPIIVNQTPTFTVNAPTAQCVGNIDLSSSVQSLTPAGATLSYHDAMIGGNTVANPVSATGLNTYYIGATANGCPSARQPVTVRIDESVTVTPPIITPVCTPTNVDITGTVNVAGINITYHQGNGGTGAIVSDETAISTPGNYSLKAVNGTCNDTKDITVTINERPRATISGNPTVCTGENGDLTVTVTGGASPYDIVYNRPVPPVTGTANNETSPYTLQVSDIGNYTLVSVTDDNDCAATLLQGVGSIANTPALVVSNVDASCNLTTREATVVFDLNSGQPAYSITTEVPLAGTLTGGTDYSVTFPADGATAYNYVVEDASGCVYNTDVSAATGSINCSCGVSGTIALTTAGTEEICEGASTSLTVSLSGTVAPSDYSFDLLKDGVLNQSFTGESGPTVVVANITEAGTYTIENVAGNCPGSANGSVAIVVNELPEASISGSPTVCTGDNGDLTVTVTGGASPYDIVYNRPVAPATGTATDETSPYTLQVSGAGSYTLASVTDDKGCAATSLTGTGSIANVPNLSIDNVKDFCDLLSKSATISFDLSSGKPSYSATREDPASGSFINGNMYSVTFGSDVDTPYEYRVKDASGCLYNTDLLATDGVINCSCGLTADLALSTSGSDKFCEGGSTSLQVTLNGIIAPSTYSFDLLKDGSLEQQFTGESGPTVEITNITDAGRYSLANVDGHCKGTSNGLVDIIVIPTPVANPSNNGPLCESDEGVLVGMPEAMNGYIWDGPAGFSSFNQNPIILNSQVEMSGEYGLIVQKNGCVSARATTVLMVDERPVINFSQFGSPETIATNSSQETVVDYDIEVNVIDDQDMIYTWEGFGVSGRLSKDLEIVLPANYEGLDEYTLTVINQENQDCFDTQSFELLSSLPFDVPNAFSPNGDGVNDTWIIQGLSRYPGSNVQIFNRWGNSVYDETYSLENAWSGEGYPVGTYYYIIKINNEAWKEPLTGSLTVTR